MSVNYGKHPTLLASVLAAFQGPRVGRNDSEHAERMREFRRRRPNRTKAERKQRALNLVKGPGGRVAMWVRRFGRIVGVRVVKQAARHPKYGRQRELARRAR